jgi:hypothetical protein
MEAMDLTSLTTRRMIANLTIDTLAPTLDIDGKEIVVNTTDLTINETTEPLAKVHVWKAGTSPDPPYEWEDFVTADEEGTFEVTPYLVEGANILKITSMDRAGNMVEGTFYVIVDKIPPSLIINNPDGDYIWITMSRIEFIFTIIPNYDPWVEWWFDGDEPNLVEPIPAVCRMMVDLEEGENLVVIWLRDWAGNTVSYHRRIIRDTVPPVLTIDSPSETDFFTLEQKVDLQGEVHDLNLLNITLNGEELTVLDGLFTGILLIEEGENVFRIEARDMAGNEASHNITIRKDTLPPEYTLEAVVEDGTLFRVEDELYATAPGPGSPPLVLTFTIDEWTRIVALGGLGEVEGDGPLVLVLDLEEGPNSFTLTLEDEVGNRASPLSYDVVLDMTAPEIRVDGPIDVKTRDKTHRLTGQVEPGSTLTIDGEAVQVNPDGSFNTQLELTVGENTFQLVATDVVGLTDTYYFKIVRQKKAEDGPGLEAIHVLVAIATLAVVVSHRRRS